MPLLSYRIVSKNSVSSVTAASEPFMITPMIAIGSMRVFFISAIIPNTKPGIANMKVDAASEPPSGGENSDDVPVSDMNSEIIPVKIEATADYYMIKAELMKRLGQ